MNAALRRCVSELKGEYPNISFDAIKDEKDVYFDSLGEEREPNDLMADRGRELFSWLKDRPETNIAVVGDGCVVRGGMCCLLTSVLISC